MKRGSINTPGSNHKQGALSRKLLLTREEGTEVRRRLWGGGEGQRRMGCWQAGWYGSGYHKSREMGGGIDRQTGAAQLAEKMENWLTPPGHQSLRLRVRLPEDPICDVHYGNRPLFISRKKRTYWNECLCRAFCKYFNFISISVSQDECDHLFFVGYMVRFTHVQGHMARIQTHVCLSMLHLSACLLLLLSLAWRTCSFCCSSGPGCSESPRSNTKEF